MANSWALDENWDMYLDENNGIARVVGIDEVNQHVEERVQFFYEEWFLDRDAGVPWYQQIFKKPFNQPLTEALLKKEIIETPGVVELVEFNVVIDPTNRTYKVPTFVVLADTELLKETL